MPGMTLEEHCPGTCSWMSEILGVGHVNFKILSRQLSECRVWGVVLAGEVGLGS